MTLGKKYEDVDVICSVCKGTIKKKVCRTHDEEFEIGHDENCPNRNTEIRIGDDCVTERVD